MTDGVVARTIQMGHLGARRLMTHRLRPRWFGPRGHFDTHWIKARGSWTLGLDAHRLHAHRIRPRRLSRPCRHRARRVIARTIPATAIGAHGVHARRKPAVGLETRPIRRRPFRAMLVCGRAASFRPRCGRPRRLCARRLRAPCIRQPILTPRHRAPDRRLIVVGDDASDGSQDLFHGRLLRLWMCGHVSPSAEDVLQPARNAEFQYGRQNRHLSLEVCHRTEPLQQRSAAVP